RCEVPATASAQPQSEMRFRSGGYVRSRANVFPGSFCSANSRCGASSQISVNIITPRGIIKAKTTSCCFLGQLYRNLPVGGPFDATSGWVGCSNTIGERRLKGGFAIPDAGILLGRLSLPSVGGSEADDRRTLVVVACPVAFLGGPGPQRFVNSSRVRLSLFRRRRRSWRR